MKRVTFSTFGTHPLMGLCAVSLIEAGYQAIHWTSDVPADFVLIGEHEGEFITSTPSIILSSSDVYCCLDSDRKVVERAFSEHDALVIPSTNACFDQMRAIQHETVSRMNCSDHAVLRLFDVYGPGCAGLVTSYIHASEPYVAWHSEYRRLSQLYVDDFKEMFLAFCKVFLTDKVRGVYNVCNSDSLTLKHLIETVHQAKTNNREKALLEVKHPLKFVSFYCVGDSTRLQAITGYTPKTSLRKGIFLTVEASRHGN